MNKQEIQTIIFQALHAINEERSEAEQISISSDTVLFGDQGVLDSLTLVSLIVDVEMAVEEASGKSISLTDDRAMNQPQYPFGNVSLLTEYIASLLAD